MTSSFQCVVDANIAIKQFIKDPLTDKVHQLFAHLEKNASAQFYVPDLFYIECANVLLKYVRANVASIEKVMIDISDLKALRLQSVSNKSLSAEALKVSAKYNISAYDGSYVVLSDQIGAPLLTLDKRLFQAMESSSFDVRLFTNFSIPPLPSRQ